MILLILPFNDRFRRVVGLGRHRPGYNRLGWNYQQFRAVEPSLTAHDGSTPIFWGA